MPFLATLPPLVGSAIIGGGATLAGSALQARGAGRATEASLAANRQALNYQRQSEARRRQDWQRAMDEYNARRAALFRRYDIDVELPQAAPAAQAPGAVPRGGYEGLTMRELMMRHPRAQPPVM